jgi:lipoyl(octanoyl) transferase
MEVRDLGLMPYRQAWDLQEQVHQSVARGGAETSLIVEHPPVVTLGRREDSIRNLTTPLPELEKLGIELVHSDRGGDITYHGPGQIVAYPIIRLADHGFSVSGYVHRLEAIVVAALAEVGIEGVTDPQAVGVWTEDRGHPAKICAIGVRIRRGISLHGLALNVETDLGGFSHIVPCGLAGRAITSVGKILGENAPAMDAVKKILIGQLLGGFLPARRSGRDNALPT